MTFGCLEMPPVGVEPGPAREAPQRAQGCPCMWGSERSLLRNPKGDEQAIMGGGAGVELGAAFVSSVCGVQNAFWGPQDTVWSTDPTWTLCVWVLARTLPTSKHPRQKAAVGSVGI